MAKRAKKKKAKQAKKRTGKKAKAKTTKAKTVKRKTIAATRKSAVKKRKQRAPRRSEADMSWAEVRQSRRKKSDSRFRRIEGEFYRKVNMTAQALDRWLKSKDSRAAATPHSAADDSGHWSGKADRRDHAEEKVRRLYARGLRAHAQGHRLRRPPPCAASGR